jgi:hypothetical protein
MTRLWLTVLVLGFVAVCAIGCGRSDAASEQVCAYDSACHSGYHCGPGGVCLGDVACTSSAECCLAEQCVKGLCKRRQMCSQAAPCGKPSAICTKKMCVPGPCVSNDDCSAPLRCMVGTCRSASPCSGSCAAGSACAVQLNRCVKLHAAAPHCKVGELAVVLNEVSLFDEGCAAIAPVFGCHKLPALSPPQYGLVAKVVRLGTKLAVLAHERTHGDLLLALHGAAPPHSREDVRVVAGVPADAAVVADPSGPRGGVDAHGDTVGDTIAAARVGSGAHVAYHDATAHTLRYLALDAAGDVGNDHLVKALSGRAVALAVDALGTPWLATFDDPKAGNDAAGQRAVHLFKATGSQPTSASSWGSFVVTTEKLAMRPKSPIGAEFRRGRGAHLAIAVRGATAVVAAYSALQGDIRLYRGGVQGPFSSSGIPSAAIGTGKQDYGRFAAMVLSATGLARVVCQDARGGRVLLLEEVKPGGPLKATVLDDGVRADGHHRVGAGASVLQMADGGLVVSYQDTRLVRPVVLRVSGKGKIGSPITLKGAAAGGFAAAVLATGDKSVAVGSATVVFNADATASVGYKLVPVVLSAQ